MVSTSTKASLRSRMGELRQQVGMTQQELAETIGVTERTITAWEKSIPNNFQVAFALASFFRAEIETLFEGNEITALRHIAKLRQHHTKGKTTFTQRQLAEAIQVTEKTIRVWEKEEHLTIEKLKELCTQLRCTRLSDLYEQSFLDSKTDKGSSTYRVLFRNRTAQFFPEDRLSLEPGQPPLEMVYIPPGSFTMGSPEGEQGRYNDEGPQHEVTIFEPFFIGKHPITQAQWRAVSALPQIKRDLKPNPSNFEGDSRPVEQITWHDAVEFCARLAEATHRPYRLPSEAEWEYACRAGTTTPFHFGPTITTDLANYRGQDLEYEGKTDPGNYGDGPYGEYRDQTTDVGSFEGSNAFGLYDMHGNVWEWCQDRSHDSYEGAPSDGTAWLMPPEDEEEEHRVLRGGSWFNNPENCRSASRRRLPPGGGSLNLGLRVVCALARA